MKIAIYSRKSKYTGKGDSIGNQIQMCKDYIETHYRNNDPEYIIYEDEGFSGGNISFAARRKPAGCSIFL